VQPTSAKHGWPDIGTTKISVITMPTKMKSIQNDIRYEYMYNSCDTNIFPKFFLTIILFSTHSSSTFYVRNLTFLYEYGKCISNLPSECVAQKKRQLFF
jgi:hypothetical protein